MGEQMAAASTFVLRIGRRIRDMRKQRGWSVQRLADVSGLSRRMLTQIELGQANPSLATIDRIAHGLGTDFAAIALPEAEPVPHAMEGILAWQGPGDSRALLLSATIDPRAELWRWTLNPQVRYEAEPDRLGAQEIHHVLSGTLTLVLEDEQLVVASGQTTTIRTDQRYAYLNDTARPVTFIRVVTGA
ncbi:helix-turn-helix domain-containing protein [Austwickia chelonae]|nr:XRE family transcriptional regulator [Austwickia chelonae]